MTVLSGVTGAASAAKGSELARLGARPQQTLARPVVVAGFGYWSGVENRVELRPAPAGSGVVFVREDMGDVRVAVSLDHRIEASSRTNLQVGSTTVEMVEHLLSALAALQVDCCEVGLTAAELPGLDGSAQAYVHAIDSAGVIQHEEVVRPLRVVEPITLEVADEGACIDARPPTTEGFSVRYELDYSGKPIPPQQFELAVTPQHYRDEIAGARTFLPEDAARRLQKQGLGLAVTTSDLLVFGPTGPIDNPLRWPNECARHKALDVIGDLSLAGRPIHADVIARRSGHRLNAALLRAMLSAESQRQE